MNRLNPYHGNGVDNRTILKENAFERMNTIANFELRYVVFRDGINLTSLVDGRVER